MPKINPQRRDLIEGIERTIADLEVQIGNWNDSVPTEVREALIIMRDRLERLMVRAGRRAGPTIGTKE
jgi:hypothetical protein